jgi:hypothetical protein
MGVLRGAKRYGNPPFPGVRCATDRSAELGIHAREAHPAHRTGDLAALRERPRRAARRRRWQRAQRKRRRGHRCRGRRARPGDAPAPRQAAAARGGPAPQTQAQTGAPAPAPLARASRARAPWRGARNAGPHPLQRSAAPAPGVPRGRTAPALSCRARGSAAARLNEPSSRPARRVPHRSRASYHCNRAPLASRFPQTQQGA